MKNMKYIMLPEGPIVFPEYIAHKDVDKHKTATSAGFFTLDIKDKKAVVWGKSVTLNLESNPKDALVLTVMFFEMEYNF